MKIFLIFLVAYFGIQAVAELLTAIDNAFSKRKITFKLISWLVAIWAAVLLIKNYQ